MSPLKKILVASAVAAVVIVPLASWASGRAVRKQGSSCTQAQACAPACTTACASGDQACKDSCGAGACKEQACACKCGCDKTGACSCKKACPCTCGCEKTGSCSCKAKDAAGACGQGGCAKDKCSDQAAPCVEAPKSGCGGGKCGKSL